MVSRYICEEGENKITPMIKKADTHFKIQRLIATDLTNDSIAQINTLFTQLNASIKQGDPRDIVDSHGLQFWVCWDSDTIVGMALMATYHVISGRKGMIEDVVVHEDYRGKGIGKQLIKALINEGERMQLNDILLFTGHHRKPAISLYTSLGFRLKESGLYSLKLN